MTNNQSLTDEEIVADVKSCYFKLASDRKPFEQSWLLNMNFLMGNQYSYISPNGDLIDSPKTYAYESREVFNHIAPIIEARLAKLSRVRPTFGVRPASSSCADLQSAKLVKSILTGLSTKLDLSSIISKASFWSEVCGTSFYKVYWDENIGTLVGYTDDCSHIAMLDEEKPDDYNTKVFDGDVKIEVCSPFEIFPANSFAPDIQSQEYIIHAKIVDKQQALKLYNLQDVKTESLDSLVYDSEPASYLQNGKSNTKKMASVKLDNQVLILEKWQKPTNEYPNGRLIIVCGDSLVYNGSMPNSSYPFVKQDSMGSLGSFWGTSVIERVVPVQRAYNAVKNRKIEFLARLSAGVLAVEEGSVDIDDLEYDGLTPGKIVVYRQGSNMPSYLPYGQIPPALSQEEDRLYAELVSLSGVSELMSNSSLPNNISSGTAINLLIEQDDTRLSVPAENIRKATLELSKIIVALYKLNASVPKLVKVAGDDGAIEVFYFDASDLSSDDIILESSNELNESQSARKNLVIELFKMGLLTEDDGKVSTKTKAKIIDMLGFNMLENANHENNLHIKRASSENLNPNNLMVLEIDDHDIHISEHTKYLLENDNLLNDENIRTKLFNHIREHKNFKGIMESNYDIKQV